MRFSNPNGGWSERVVPKTELSVVHHCGSCDNYYLGGSISEPDMCPKCGCHPAMSYQTYDVNYDTATITRLEQTWEPVGNDYMSMAVPVKKTVRLWGGG